MSSEFNFFCDKCNYGTNNKMSMVVHEHTTLHLTGKHGKTNLPKGEKKIYVCDKCDFTNPNKINFLVHKLGKHATKEERKQGFKFYCEFCDFGVMTKSLFNTHLDTMTHKYKHAFANNQIQIKNNISDRTNSINNNDQVNV